MECYIQETEEKMAYKVGIQIWSRVNGVMGFLTLQRSSMHQKTKNMQRETENGKIHEAYHGLFNTKKKRMKLKKLLD